MATVQTTEQKIHTASNGTATILTMREGLDRRCLVLNNTASNYDPEVQTDSPYLMDER
mgnify:CR=1 FL=1